MSLKQTTVTVIVPVYNVQNYLEKCVRSILAQTFSDFELIMVDDGSTDESPRICDQLAQADSRVTVIHKPNGGLSSARNAALDIAQGKYIAFIDSDDYVEPRLLEKTVAAMEAGNYDWCAYGMRKEDTQGNLLEPVCFKPRTLRIENEQERMAFLLKNLLNYRIGWEACSHLYRGDIIRENKLRFVSERQVFAEDLLFSFTYWLYAASCIVLEEPLYHYLQRSGSLMEASRHRNILPQLQDLTHAAYAAAERAGCTHICRDFAIIYLHLLEWHTRFPIRERGVPSVMQELKTLNHNAFLPRDPQALKTLWQDLMERYGMQDGLVTLVIRIPEQIPSLLSQSLQKLDILLLIPAPVELPDTDLRVRQVVCRDMTPSGILRTAFSEGWGEYLCFPDITAPLPSALLETFSDAAKYNDCSAVFRASRSAFLDRDSLVHRREFRDLVWNLGAGLIRRDLLAESGLGCMTDLMEYLPEILLSGHILLTDMVYADEERDQAESCHL